MRIKNLELWAAFLVIGIVTVFYVQTVASSDIPPASGFFGHTLGVIGFILMLMTEVLYSLRKRYQFARWGKLEHWLSFHIFTGITGPYLVLLHTSWKFNGLAGVLTLLTIIIVLSGFIGRYFYTSIPRSMEGGILEAEAVSHQIQQIEHNITQADNQHPLTENEIKKLNKEQNHLKNLDRSRRLLAIWHTFHIPVGVALFTLALLHIAATLYFSTLLH